MNEKKKYLRRLGRLSERELMALKRHLVANPNRKFGKYMLSLVTTALLAKVGLS